jgi:hypothetical protein
MRKVGWLVLMFLVAALTVFVLSLAWDRPTFFSGLLGALIGSAASLSGIALAQRYARERDRESYQRAVATGRVDRLRAHYIALVRAAQAFEEAGTELNLLWAGDTSEARDTRVADNLRRVLGDLDTVFAAVRLEPGTDDVLKEWRESMRSYFGVKHILETRRTMPDAFTTQDLINELSGLKRHVSHLTDLAVAHLQRLESVK